MFGHATSKSRWLVNPSGTCAGHQQSPAQPLKSRADAWQFPIGYVGRGLVSQPVSKIVVQPCGIGRWASASALFCSPSARRSIAFAFRLSASIIFFIACPPNTESAVGPSFDETQHRIFGIVAKPRVNANADFEPLPNEVARSAPGKPELRFAHMVLVVTAACAQTVRPARGTRVLARHRLRSEAVADLRVIDTGVDVADAESLHARQPVAQEEAALRVHREVTQPGAAR